MGNEWSGSAGKVVQVGEVQGDLNLASITYARNDDIGVDLRHEHREVHLRVDAEERFYVTVTNRSDRVRRLRFRVEGATGLQWEVVSDGAEAVSLPANGEVQLRLVVRCAATAPMAGAAEVKVLVGDAAEGIWWPSNAKPVFVEPAPRLGASMNAPDVRVAEPGTYELTVRLANEGNTPLPVEMSSFTDFDGLDHPEWLSSARVRVVGDPSFTLGYGDPPADVRVEIALPGQDFRDKTWHIPLRAKVKREDAPPVEQRYTVLQHGLLSDLVEWGRTEETRERRTLAAWAALPLAMGIALGTIIGGPPSTPPVQAGAATFSASVDVSQPEVTRMRCDPGMSVLVLHSLKDDDSPAEVKLRMDFETLWVRQRAAATPALKDHVARLSTRDTTCPAVLGGDRPTPANFTRFVWIGPFPSDSAPALCEALLKVVGGNCIPARVA